MKKNHAACVAVALVLTVGGLFVGCSKNEEPKEVPKPAIQQAAPAAATMAPAAGSANIMFFTFEDGVQKWSNRKGVALKQNTTESHGGKASLEISGTSGPKIWSFVGSPIFELESGKHYKFSGWMKIKSFDSSNKNQECFLKVDIFKDKKQIKNVSSKKYDLAQKGTWQLLTGEFKAPADSNLFGNFVIIKNPNEQSVTATIYLDDMKIEQIK